MKTFGDLFREGTSGNERVPVTIYKVVIDYGSTLHSDMLERIESSCCEVYVQWHRSTAYRSNEEWYTFAYDKYAGARHQNFDFRGRDADDKTMVTFGVFASERKVYLFSCKEAFDEWCDKFIKKAQNTLNSLTKIKNIGCVNTNDIELQDLAEAIGVSTYRYYQ